MLNQSITEKHRMLIATTHLVFMGQTKKTESLPLYDTGHIIKPMFEFENTLRD